MLTAHERGDGADRAEKDAGMTLTEVLVSMGLLLIVMTLGMNFFVGTGRTASNVTGQTLTAETARTTVAQIATLLRLADTPTFQAGYSTSRITTVSSSEIVFYSNVVPGGRSGTASRIPPTKVDIVASGTTLTEKLWAPISNSYGSTPSSYNYLNNYATNPTTTTVLTSRLSNAGSAFTFCNSTTDPMTTCTPTVNGASVAAVGVAITLSGATGEDSESAQTMVAINGALS